MADFSLLSLMFFLAINIDIRVLFILCNTIYILYTMHQKLVQYLGQVLLPVGHAIFLSDCMGH